MPTASLLHTFNLCTWPQRSAVRNSVPCYVYTKFTHTDEAIATVILSGYEAGLNILLFFGTGLEQGLFLYKVYVTYIEDDGSVNINL